MNNVNLNNMNIETLLPLMENIFKEYSFLKINNPQKFKIIEKLIEKTSNEYNNSIDYSKYLGLQLEEYLYNYTKKCLHSKEKSVFIINNYLLSLQLVDSFESAKENFYNLKSFVSKYNYNLNEKIIRNLISNSEIFNNTIKYFLNENDSIKNDDLIKFICTLYYRKINDDMLNVNYSNNSVSNGNLLDKIYRIPLLSEDEKKKVFYEYKNGSINARDRIIEAHMRLVADIARKYQGYSLPIEDMFQEGCLGLVEALKRFDVNKNIEFNTYAYYWIKSYIIRAIKSKGRMIRIPETLYDKLLKFKKAKNILESKLARDASIEEMAEYLNISVKTVSNYLEYLCEPISLNTEVCEDGQIEDNLESNELGPEEIICLTDKNAIKSIIGDAQLTEKQLLILNLRFGFSGRVYTLQEIAKMMNISWQAVDCFEKRAIKKLQKSKNIEEYRLYLD